MLLLLLRLIGLLFFQISLNAFAIGFTSPSSLLRLFVFPVILICLQQTLPICLEATGRVLWAALLGAHSITFVFQYVDTALLSRWSPEAGGPTKGKGRQRMLDQSEGLNQQETEIPFGRRLSFGYYAAVSTRNIGTSFEVPGVPRFSAKDPSYVPSKSTFLRQKALLLLSCYLVLDAFNFLSQPGQNQLLYNDSEVSLALAKNRSAERIIVRSASTLGFWVSLYCIIQLYMGSVAVLSVGLGLSDVRSWRPGFGPVNEAYTVRRFWG